METSWETKKTWEKYGENIEESHDFGLDFDEKSSLKSSDFELLGASQGYE